MDKLSSQPAASDRERPFLFLVGCSRSGTTLLSRLLECHPRIAVTPETHFVKRWWRALHRFSTPRKRARVLESLLSSPLAGELKVDPNDRDRLMRCLEQPRPGARLFAELLTGFARATGKPVAAEKTPHHLTCLPLFAEAYPRARFVHIVRDPRAAAASAREAFGGNNIWLSAARWGWYMHLDRLYRSRFPQRYCSLRYEDLVREPEAALRALCGFIDEDFDDRMLHPEAGSTANFDVDKEPWKQGALKPITTERVERWRELLSDDEVAGVELLAGLRAMRAFSYEPVSESLVASGLWRSPYRNALLGNRLRTDIKRLAFPIARTLMLGLA